MALKPPTQKEASMKQTILYVGLDVDDTQYHGSAFDQHSGAGIDFHCRPALKGLLRQLEKLGQYFAGLRMGTRIATHWRVYM